MTAAIDKDALIAAADAIGRSGARQFQVGYLHDDVPSEQAGWYATASYKGARVIAENHPGPVEAAEALVRRLLDGGTCVACGRKVAIDRLPLTTCRWTRQGDRWTPGCEATS